MYNATIAQPTSETLREELIRWEALRRVLEHELVFTPDELDSILVGIAPGGYVVEATLQNYAHKLRLKRDAWRVEHPGVPNVPVVPQVDLINLQITHVSCTRNSHYQLRKERWQDDWQVGSDSSSYFNPEDGWYAARALLGRFGNYNHDLATTYLIEKGFDPEWVKTLW